MILEGRDSGVPALHFYSPMNWLCDIPGASAVSAMHFALHLSLAAFVVGAGIVFVCLAVVAYRRPVPAAVQETSADRRR